MATKPSPPQPDAATSLEQREVQAKRRFVITAFFVFLGAQALNILFKGIQAQWWQVLFHILVVPPVLITIHFILRAQRPRWEYAVLVLFTLSFVFLQLFIPSHNVSGLLLLYSMPVLSFTLMGSRDGRLAVAVLLVAVLVLLFFPGLFGLPAFSASFTLHFLTSLTLLCVLSGTIETLTGKTLDHCVTATTSVQHANEQLTDIERLVPICSYCKNMRDDEGYWHHLGEFLEKNTGARVSYGICDACVAEGHEAANTPARQQEKSPTPIVKEAQKFSASKPLFVFLVANTVALTTFFFSMRDFYLGNSVKALLQVTLSMLLSGAALYQLRRQGAVLANNFVVLGVALVLLLPYLGNRPEPAEILWCFHFPVLAIYLSGHRWGALWSGLFAGALLLVFLNPPFLTAIAYPAHFIYFFSLAFMIVAIFSWRMEHLRTLYMNELTTQIETLTSVTEEIDSLRVLVPVCAVCKSIRNDEGFWTSIESHLLNTASFKLTHGICATCLQEEFPQMWARMEEEKQKS